MTSAQVVAYAEQLVEDLRTAGLRATCDPRSAVPPCVLVVPVPDRSYDVLAGFTAAWTVAVIGAGPGDLTDARKLGELVDEVAALVDVETVEAASYMLPTSPDPRPAYLVKFRTVVTP